MGRLPSFIKKVDNLNCDYNNCTWICFICNTHLSIKKEAYLHPSKCELLKNLRTTRRKSGRLINNKTILCSTKKFKRNTYIMNGATCGILFYKQAFYNVINTCAFDSILVGIVVAYTDYSTFSCSVDNIMDNKFLKMAKSLALQNQKDKQLFYLQRLDLLQQHFKVQPNELGNA
ncbi:uncharacterized protein LOC112591239 [Melanaphis sacchari]|uniref:uncharacterized protein LOC112591239 n=1 Tax=Melanaphis sacchari TaxID=742174 RepID=UPI000DC157DA|nr:uncharacterized protein LOC112591239 [Melanaphis sacchari]